MIFEHQEMVDRRIRLLMKNCDAFDNDRDEDEALNISVALRTLLHDTGKSKSILGIAGIKHKLPYIDTCPEVIENTAKVFWVASWCGLAPFDRGFMSGVMGYRARLSAAPVARRLSFHDWWVQTVFVDPQGHKLTRKDFVCNMANKDGGAHYDPDDVPVRYQVASQKKHESRFLTYPDGSYKPVASVAKPAIRQIAHEFLETYIPYYWKLPIDPFYPEDTEFSIAMVYK